MSPPYKPNSVEVNKYLDYDYRGYVASVLSPIMTITSISDVSLPTSYNLYWSNVPDVNTITSNKVIITPSPDGTYTHTPLVANPFYYRLTSLMGASESSPSHQEMGVVGSSDFPVFISSDSSKNYLFFDILRSYTYTVYWSKSLMNKNTLYLYNSLSTTNGSPFIHDTLSNNTNYYYIVMRTSPAGSSEYSPQVGGMPETSLLTSPTLAVSPNTSSMDIFTYSNTIRIAGTTISLAPEDLVSPLTVANKITNTAINGWIAQQSGTSLVFNKVDSYSPKFYIDVGTTGIKVNIGSNTISGASPFLITGTSAIKNNIKLYLMSQKGDYGRNVEKGGIVFNTLGKSMTDAQANTIKQSITDAVNSFQNVVAGNVTVTPDLLNKRWIINVSFTDTLNKIVDTITLGV